MLFKNSRVQHGDKSFLRADPRIVLGYHKEVHNHHTVINETKSDGPARVGVLVMAAYFAFEHREAIAKHGGPLVRAVGGALHSAGTRAWNRLGRSADAPLQIEDAKVLTASEASQPEAASAGAQR